MDIRLKGHYGLKDESRINLLRDRWRISWLDLATSIFNMPPTSDVSQWIHLRLTWEILSKCAESVIHTALLSSCGCDHAISDRYTLASLDFGCMLQPRPVNRDGIINRNRAELAFYS